MTLHNFLDSLYNLISKFTITHLTQIYFYSENKKSSSSYSINSKIFLAYKNAYSNYTQAQAICQFNSVQHRRFSEDVCFDFFTETTIR